MTTVNWDKRVSVSEKFEEIITQCNNLFYNNISIVGNYGNLARDMGARIMEAYLHVFECIDWKHIWEGRIIAEILEKSRLARALIDTVIQVNSSSQEVSDYYAPLRERCYQIKIFEIVNEFHVLHDRLIDGINWKSGTISPSVIGLVANDYVDAYLKWIEVASEYTEHELKLKEVIIDQYCTLFDGFNYLKDIRELAHCLYGATRRIVSDISQYVSWMQDSAQGILSDTENYSTLVSKCLNFTRIEMHEIYYKQAKKVLRSVVADVKNDFSLVTKGQLNEICMAYQESYYQCFDLCHLTKDKTLAAENIDLFYSLITEVGINLQGSLRKHFDSSIEHTCSQINNVRTILFSTMVRDIWKKADAYWNSGQASKRVIG